MNSKVEQSKAAGSAGDIAKYVLAALLAVAGLVVYWWFKSRWAAPLPMVAAVVGLALGGLVFLTSAKGHEVRHYLAESRFELRKVVWPTRQEAMRLTWVVMFVVVVVSLIMAGFDVTIRWLIEKLFTLGR